MCTYDDDDDGAKSQRSVRMIEMRRVLAAPADSDPSTALEAGVCERGNEGQRVGERGREHSSDAG